MVLLAVGAGVASLGGREALQARLAQMQPAWMLAAIALMLVGLLLTGPRFRALLPAGDYRRPGALAAGTLLMGSTVLNLSFPGPVGELAVAAALQHRYAIPAPTALATSLHGRFSGLAASGLLVLLLLPFVDVPAELLPMLWALAGLLGLAGLAAGVVSLRPDLLAALARLGPAALEQRLPGAAGRACGKLARGIDKVAHDLAAGVAIGPLALLRGLAWSTASHAVFGGAVLCCAAAVGAPLAPLPALVAHAASVVASVALIILPGGLGAWDASFGGVLVLAGGLSLDQAALVLVAVRLVQVLGMGGSALAFLGWSQALLSAPALDEA